MEINNLQGTTTLRNGVKMPYFGLGMYKTGHHQQVIEALLEATAHGYRLFDTAAIYGNERAVGEAIAQSTLPRSDLFITSKVWNTAQGYDSTLRAFDQTMSDLRLEYLDLYLIHWPVKTKYKDTWRALETLYAEKRVRAIGTSNFLQHHLEDLMATAQVVPMLNQMEFHPYLVQQSLLDFCAAHSIQYQSWSPLMRGKVNEIPLLQELATKYGKTVVQIVLRWNLQKRVAVIPKSSQRERIISNANVFDFAITPPDMAAIDKLDRHYRTDADPDNFEF